MWHRYLHPSFNKTKWTEEEDKKLLVLAKKYRYQNWSQITLELGTNRPEITTCRRYYKLCSKFKKGEFTYEEDKKILETVHRYKIGNLIQWNKVVKHFTDRSRNQIHHRYTYFLNQDLLKRGKFSLVEDIMLLVCVDKFGKNFKKCAQYLPDRSMIQCKARYSNNLERAVRKFNWTVEEDTEIMSHVSEHGPKYWADLAKIMQRSRAQLRQRYLRIKSHLDTQINMELSEIPRRQPSAIMLKKGPVDRDYEMCRLVADILYNSF